MLWFQIFYATYTKCKSIITHVKNMKILRTIKIYVPYTKIEQLHVNSLWIQAPRNEHILRIVEAPKQAAKRKENSQRNSKALHFSEIGIRRVQY